MKNLNLFIITVIMLFFSMISLISTCNSLDYKNRLLASLTHLKNDSIKHRNDFVVKESIIIKQTSDIKYYVSELEKINGKNKDLEAELKRYKNLQSHII